VTQLTYLKHGLLALALMLAALLPLRQAQAEQCGQETFDEAKYVVCTLEVGKVDLRLFWKGADGEPYRAFSSLAEAVRAEGRKLTFAVRARDGIDLISEGTHERYVIDRGRFDAKMADKASRA